ncbi:MAG: hypothetical protein AUK47_21615 [Deltaproteobacteria bacterium CG2_30_63_29]|nr:MAG: hypothetical protein AUK47_21615 [Deltaproteobacteria bacterium CG2_30_63_29]
MFQSKGATAHHAPKPKLTTKDTKSTKSCQTPPSFVSFVTFVVNSRLCRAADSVARRVHG